MSHQAHRAAFDGYRKAIAFEIGKSSALVDRWCCLAESEGGTGAPSPAQHVVDMTRAATLVGAPDADAIVRWINTELGYAPPLRIVPADGVKVVDVARATKEFSDYLGAVASRLDDGCLSPADAETIAREIEEHVGVMAAQLIGLRAVVHAEEARQVRERIGPKRSASHFIALREKTGVA